MDILPYIGIPHAHDMEALVSQVPLAPCVSCEFRICAVCSAIDLDDHALRKTRKVHNEMIDGHLLPELEAHLLQFPELPPQSTLSQRSVSAQVPCTFIRHDECDYPHP
jgi:hypothetical protein